MSPESFHYYEQTNIDLWLDLYTSILNFYYAIQIYNITKNKAETDFPVAFQILKN